MALQTGCPASLLASTHLPWSRPSEGCPVVVWEEWRTVSLLRWIVSVLSPIPGWGGRRLVVCVGCGEMGKKRCQVGEQRPPDWRELHRARAGDGKRRRLPLLNTFSVFRVMGAASVP